MVQVRTPGISEKCINGMMDYNHSTPLHLDLCCLFGMPICTICSANIFMEAVTEHDHTAGMGFLPRGGREREKERSNQLLERRTHTRARTHNILDREWT